MLADSVDSVEAIPKIAPSLLLEDVGCEAMKVFDGGLTLYSMSMMLISTELSVALPVMTGASHWQGSSRGRILLLAEVAVDNPDFRHIA